MAVHTISLDAHIDGELYQPVDGDDLEEFASIQVEYTEERGQPSAQLYAARRARQYTAALMKRFPGKSIAVTIVEV